MSPTFQGHRYCCISLVLEAHQRALALVGTPFRLQGRNPAVGLDCVGVVVHAFELQIDEAPTYSILSGSWEIIHQALAPWFEEKISREPINNDLVVFQLGRSFHFGVVSSAQFVHADRVLGKVVARRLPERLPSHCRLFSYRVD